MVRSWHYDSPPAALQPSNRNRSNRVAVVATRCRALCATHRIHWQHHQREAVGARQGGRRRRCRRGCSRLGSRGGRLGWRRRCLAGRGRGSWRSSSCGCRGPCGRRRGRRCGGRCGGRGWRFGSWLRLRLLLLLRWLLLLWLLLLLLLWRSRCGCSCVCRLGRCRWLGCRWLGCRRLRLSGPGRSAGGRGRCRWNSSCTARRLGCTGRRGSCGRGRHARRPWTPCTRRRRGSTRQDSHGRRGGSAAACACCCCRCRRGGLPHQRRRGHSACHVSAVRRLLAARLLADNLALLQLVLLARRACRAAGQGQLGEQVCEPHTGAQATPRARHTALNLRTCRQCVRSTRPLRWPPCQAVG